MPETPKISNEQSYRLLRLTVKVAEQAMRHGHHPFGAILVGPDNTILMQQANLNTVRHAESELCRRAFEMYGPEFLWDCALVSNFEPCAMCAATQYWANIGTLIYGANESALKKLTGDHGENPTMNLPCRKVFAAGQKAIHVRGPFPELEEEILAPHRDFWRNSFVSGDSISPRPRSPH